ncbi:hypothetical protein CROQUDRAFT_101045, partial [Cronartium quercuum f. sp. fusiforme G11]
MQSTKDITMDVPTSTPSSDNVSEIIATALKKQASYFETIISNLQTQISSLNMKKPASPKEKQQKATSSASSKSPKTPKTPKTLTPTCKRHPLQVMVVDTPKDFKSCKDVLYVHIKMMWGLYKPSDVPPTTDAALLKEFYTQFNSAEEVESVVNNPSSTDLIAQESIMSLKELHTGSQKIACGLGHIDEIAILYISSILAKVGIRAWGPDLNDAPNSLYNSACQITALNTFHQLLASLLPTRHPNEQLGDAKFTAKYLDVFLEVYDLSNDEGEGFEDSDEKEDSDQSDESLDSDVEGEEEDEEESEFYEEGKYGDLYDNEATESGDDN